MEVSAMFYEYTYYVFTLFARVTRLLHEQTNMNYSVAKEKKWRMKKRKEKSELLCLANDINDLCRAWAFRLV